MAFTRTPMTKDEILRQAACFSRVKTDSYQHCMWLTLMAWCGMWPKTP